MANIVTTSIVLYPDQLERVDKIANQRRSKRSAVLREIVEIALVQIERDIDTATGTTVNIAETSAA